MMLKKILSIMIILSLPQIAHSWSRDRDTYESKKCGQIKIKPTEDKDSPEVCRLDNGVMDIGHKTKGSLSEIMAPLAFISKTKHAGEVVDEVLLEKIKEKAQQKLKGLDPIMALPDNEETSELKNEVKEFRSLVLNSKADPIHQIHSILSIYPTIQDEILAQHPDYEPLFCKYEVWKHRRLTLNKVAKVSSKIMTLSILVGTLPAVGAAFYGVFSIQTLGTVMMAVGGTEVGLAGFHAFTVGQNWDDVRAGRMAKRLLKINDELKDYIKDLQKNPADNEAQILAAQSLLISPSEQKELKELNKQKNERVRELISSGLRVVLGSLTFKAGHVIHKRFSDFKTSEPASIVNPHNGGGGGGGNGFPVDDGG